MPQMSVNVSGTWHKVKQPYVNVNGSWKKVKKAWTNVNGTWKQVFTGETWSEVRTLRIWHKDVFWGYSDNPPVPDIGQSSPSRPKFSIDGIHFELSQILYDSHRTGSRLREATSIRIGMSDYSQPHKYSDFIVMEYWIGSEPHQTIRMKRWADRSGGESHTYLAASPSDYTRFAEFKNHVGTSLSFRIRPDSPFEVH